MPASTRKPRSKTPSSRRCVAPADPPLDIVERARALWEPGQVPPGGAIGDLILNMVKEIERLRGTTAPPAPPPAPTTVAAARELLKKRRAAVGAERDALRALQDDVEELITSCDEAVEGLDTAIDALSQYA